MGKLLSFIAGERRLVDADLRAAGYSRVGIDTWEKGDTCIRWVGQAEHIRGLDGVGKDFILRAGALDGMAIEAQLMRFQIVYEIPR